MNFIVEIIEDDGGKTMQRLSIEQLSEILKQ